MKICGALLFILMAGICHAQEKVNLSLAQVDSLFLKRNLFLLAKQFDIGSREALIIQARAYPNPIFTADFNAIDPQNNETFNVGSQGQKAFEIQQLIILGGKRKIQIEMAKRDHELAKVEFDDLLRNLRLQLYTSFFSIYRQRNVKTKYDQQLELLDTLIMSYEVQAGRGNLPLKDVIRLKAVYLKINNDKTEVEKEIFEEQRKMQMLLQSSMEVVPQVTSDEFESYNHMPNYDELVNDALDARPDLRAVRLYESISQSLLTYQKRSTIPDVILNASYDQRGGAFVNQKNIGISIPLPLWDRNRGNIKAARFDHQSAELSTVQKQQEVLADVQMAWNNMSLSINEYNKVKAYYTQDFEAVYQGVNYNFQRRNISILEFVDFFESYNESLGEFERVRYHLAMAATQVNYATATPIY